MCRECRYGIVDDGEPLSMIVRLYPIQQSFMNMIMSEFRTPFEQVENEGGLLVDINGEFKTFR